MAKKRLDEQLVFLGIAPTPDAAKRMVMAGEILVKEEPVLKPGTLVKPEWPIRNRRRKLNFASRAGDKLKAGLTHFKWDINGAIALDLGASTGGFTDCLLSMGARKVYAVDVGTNQLIYRLRTDPRVVCLEQTHAKDLNQNLIPQPIQVLTADVSFTSLKFVLPCVFPLLAQAARLMCLFKPQFECARQAIGAGGIVRDPSIVADTLESFLNWASTHHLKVVGPPLASPVKGREGNQEFLCAFEKP